MFANDLSADPIDRVIIIWDDLLGMRPTEIPAPDQGEPPVFAFLRKVVNRLRTAEDIPPRWQINPRVEAACKHLLWYGDVGLEVVTFDGGALEDIERLLETSEVVYNDFYATTSEQLARQISWRADVKRVYTPTPEHALRYGYKTRVLSADNCEINSLLV